MTTTQRGATAGAAIQLRAIRLVHTAVWAVLAGCVVLIPVFGWIRRFDVAIVLIAVITGEVLVLAMHGWHCPLTAVAARYTDDRRANFDIYLPEWLALYNKQIFGTLFVLGVLVTAIRWMR